MDEQRRQNIAYQYLCHLEEAKRWDCTWEDPQTHIWGEKGCNGEGQKEWVGSGYNAAECCLDPVALWLFKVGGCFFFCGGTLSPIPKLKTTQQQKPEG